MNLSQKKALVKHFLERCNGYADAKLREYETRQSTGDAPEDPALQDKIASWTSYRAFNEHAIDELATDRLDDWFLEFAPD